VSDISYNLSYRLSKDNLANNVQSSGVTATMGVAGFKSLTYALTTNTVAIQTSSLSVVGLAFLQNLSTATAATAQMGIASGTSFTSFATLRAGESALVRLSTGTQYVAIGSGGVRFRVDITEG